MKGDIEPPEFAGNEGATLHLWASDDAWTSFTSHSDPDGTYSGTISLKTGGFEVGGWQGGWRAGGRWAMDCISGAVGGPQLAARPSLRPTGTCPAPNPTTVPTPKRTQTVKTPADFEALFRSKFKGIPEEWIAPIAQQAAGQRPSPAGEWEGPRGWWGGPGGSPRVDRSHRAAGGGSGRARRVGRGERGLA
jgi:hypothetical protein